MIDEDKNERIGDEDDGLAGVTANLVPIKPDFDGRGKFAAGNKMGALANRRITKITHYYQEQFSKWMSERKFKKIINKLYTNAMEKDGKVSNAAIKIILDKVVANPTSSHDVTVSQGLSQEQQMEIIKQSIEEALH